MKRHGAALFAIALLASACAIDSRGTEAPLAEPSDEFPSCNDIPRIAADPSLYRDQPIYVANEMPVDEIRVWAQDQPGYQGIWIDREHNGWVTVAFSEDVSARQADLAEQFPDAGVVAVSAPADAADLVALQTRIGEALLEVTESFSSGIYEDKGVVGIDLTLLTPEIANVLMENFAGEPICVDAADPASLPVPGPQPAGGDGWRLLVDEHPIGDAYRTGIAYDPTSLDDLWEEIGLDVPLPEVDFESEVVIWFGAVYGSSCPNLRLDNVVVDGSTVHAVIVLPDAPIACTADANPHAYVVAVDRSKLPHGPFQIQLTAQDPPGGAPEERTVVYADLSIPGSIAQPGAVGPDTTPPEPSFVESGDYIEDGFPQVYRLHTHCGTGWLGELNGVNWRTDQPTPAEWKIDPATQTVDVEVLLSTGPPPTLTATMNGASVTYEPTSDQLPGCD